MIAVALVDHLGGGLAGVIVHLDPGEGRPGAAAVSSGLGLATDADGHGLDWRL